MAQRTPKSIIIAVVLWVVILAGMAVTVRYLVLPKMQARKRNALASQTGSEGRYKHSLTLAADGFSGYSLLRAPGLQRRLSRDGVKFTVVDDGADYLQRIKDLRDGQIDMAVFPINSFIQCGAKMGEFPGSIIYMIDETRGADAIIANKSAVPGIQTLNASDARIVVTPDSPSEFLARVMIASFNLPELPEKRWMVEEDGSSKVYKAFRGASQSKPVAYAMWEPDVSRALKDNDAHVLLDSSRVKGFIIDVLVARREYLIDSYDVARQFVEAYARTAFELQGEMVDLVSDDAKALGGRLGKPEAEQIVRGIEWKNILENYAHFGLEGSGNSLENIEDMIAKITDVLIKTGALQQDPLEDGANSLYFNKILREMKVAGFHPGRDLDILGGTDPGGPDAQVREIAQLKALTDAEWEQLETVGELRVKPIAFGRGTPRLSIKGRHELNALAATLKSWPHYYITVVGHVRAGGDADAAMGLARARADAAVAQLVAEDVAPERIRALAEVSAADSLAAQSVSFVVGEAQF